jgi:hypothetical protein
MSALYNRHSLLPTFQKVTSRFILQISVSMNSTTEIVGWAPEPRGRGTVGLLWGCFATMFLCTWNAIHLNLPGLKDSKLRIILRRVGLFLLCLVAPEMFAIIALTHFLDVQRRILVVGRMKSKVRSYYSTACRNINGSLVPHLVSQTNVFPRDGGLCCPAELSTRGTAP